MNPFLQVIAKPSTECLPLIFSHSPSSCPAAKLIASLRKGFAAIRPSDTKPIAHGNAMSKKAKLSSLGTVPLVASHGPGCSCIDAALFISQICICSNLPCLVIVLVNKAHLSGLHFHSCWCRSLVRIQAGVGSRRSFQESASLHPRASTSPFASALAIGSSGSGSNSFFLSFKV